MEAAREEIADRQVNYEDVGRRPQSFEPIFFKTLSFNSYVR